MRLGALLLWAASATFAATVEKVEPPNWWPAHTRNPIQILVTGSGLQGATVTAPRGFKTEVRYVSPDGKYLFVYAEIAKSVGAGEYSFAVKAASGNTTFRFALEKPLDAKGRFQGITGDDVIYLLMPDRFANGDPSNDGPKADRNTVLAYHGGDLKGIQQHLGYLKELGVTGVWMTPTYKNSSDAASPYHGYHAVDFYAVEPRFGTMAEYRAMVDAAHAMGIKVVQDQVANHSGPDHPWLKAPPAPKWFHELEKLPRTRNNYDIAGLADPYARESRRSLPLDGWFAGHLPDFDQTNPLVSDYLIQNALWWIGMTGVDGIRQDTYPYADRPFWEAWQTAVDRQYPGYWVTGEVTARTPAVLSFFEGGTRRRGVDTKLPSLLDFPLEQAMRRVFAEGQSMKQLDEILGQDFLFQHPERLVAFFGNHDQPRFLTLAGGDTGKLRMAEAFLLTIPRVPHLYYGDELGLGAGTDRSDRTVRADFPGGFPGDAVNGFAGTGPTYDSLRELLKLRADHKALRSGTMTTLLSEDDRVAYLRKSGEDVVLVVLTRGAGAKSLTLATGDLGLPAGRRFSSILKDSGMIETSSDSVIIGSPAPVNIYSLR